MPPPAIDLLRRNIMAPRHRDNAEVRRRDLIQYRELLRIRPKPPTLAPGKNLNSRHQSLVTSLFTELAT
jgi:hypothetical protein